LGGETARTFLGERSEKIRKKKTFTTLVHPRRLSLCGARPKKLGWGAALRHLKMWTGFTQRSSARRNKKNGVPPGKIGRRYALRGERKHPHAVEYVPRRRERGERERH